MNDTFNLKRFWWLLKKTILERPAYMLGLLGLILGCSLLVYSFFFSMGNWEPAHQVTFFLGLAGGGCFITSSIFGYFSTRSCGVSYLTLPSSHFEKWLCSVVIIVVFFVPVFLAFYRVMDITFVNLYRTSLDPALPDYKNLLERAHVYSFHDSFVTIFFIVFFNGTGAMLLGTLYFNKVSFIKTAIIMSLLFILTFILNFYISKMFFQNVRYAMPFNDVGINVGKEAGLIELPAAAFLITGFIIKYITPVCLWGLAYLRLREKEF
jgi:hypothetical protein